MGLLSSSNTLYRSETDYMRMIIADMTEKDAVAGDCNGDSIVNLADVLTALRALVNGAYLPAADLNGDGIISLSDILKLLRLCAGINAQSVKTEVSPPLFWCFAFLIDICYNENRYLLKNKESGEEHAAFNFAKSHEARSGFL